MSKTGQTNDTNVSREELKKKLIQELLRAQKVNMLDEGKASSSGSAMNIIKRLIPKR